MGRRHVQAQPQTSVVSIALMQAQCFTLLQPALAGGMAGSVREERRPGAGRPLAVAAVVDERGTQARPHGAGMSGAVECRYYGRDFTTQEMGLLRSLIAGPPALNRHALSKEFCRRIGWRKPDGGLKDMMAGVTMLAMHKDGLIALPPPKWRQNRPGLIVFGPETEPPPVPAPATLEEVRPLDMRIVVRGTAGGKRWNEFVARSLPLSRLQDPRRRPDALRRPRPRRPAGRHARLQLRRVEARAARPLHRLDAATAREEPPPRGRQPEVPHPALEQDPQPGLAHPRHRPPAPARGLSRALQHNPRAHRDLRPDPALHRRRLQGIGLDPCRNHPGTRTLRQAHETCPTEKGHLAPPTQKKLETNPQQLKSAPHHGPAERLRLLSTCQAPLSQSC